VDPLDYPIGEGVADGFALDRLAAPARMRKRAKRPVRELGWAAFGEVARTLAAEIARRFRPSVVVGVAKGGVFVGAALSTALGADFYPVRIERRSRDAGTLPEPIQELPDLTGKKVLVVDDVASTGATLARARALARKAGAREVRTAVLVARPRGARPDFAAFATDELILFGWDYQLDAADDPGEVGV
jgi:hypoxanthine phosphoribosyltransferase